MGVSKVDYNGETLIDVSGDSVAPETLAEGATAHNANGEQIVGTAVFSGGGEAVQEIAWVDAVFDLSTFSVMSVNKTYAEMVEMIDAGKYTVLRGSYALVASPVNVAFFTISAYIKENDVITFSGLVQAPVNDVLVLLSLHMIVRANDEIAVKARVVSTTDLT